MDRNYSGLAFNSCSYDKFEFEEINLFCLGRFFFNLFKFFSKKNLREIYKISIIELFSPKIVISHSIDGNAFWVKENFKNIYCVTYQHSFFYDNEKPLYISKYNKKNCDLFITFSQLDKEFLSSIINAEFLSYGSIKNNEIFNKHETRKKIEVLVISEFRKNINPLHFEMQKKFLSVIKRFCSQNKLIPYVALASNRKDKKQTFFLDEIKYFQKNLGEFNYTRENNYLTASKSNLIFCLTSNFGIELLSRGYKVMFFNLIGQKDKMQENPYLRKNYPDYFFLSSNYNEIKDKITSFYKLEEKDWLSNSQLNSNSINYDPGNSLFKEKILKILDKFRK